MAPFSPRNSYKLHKFQVTSVLCLFFTFVQNKIIEDELKKEFLTSTTSSISPTTTNHNQQSMQYSEYLHQSNQDQTQKTDDMNSNGNNKNEFQKLATFSNNATSIKKRKYNRKKIDNQALNENNSNLVNSDNFQIEKMEIKLENNTFNKLEDSGIDCKENEELMHIKIQGIRKKLHKIFS
jgi:hypothetical protein